MKPGWPLPGCLAAAAMRRHQPGLEAAELPDSDDVVQGTGSPGKPGCGSKSLTAVRPSSSAASGGHSSGACAGSSSSGAPARISRCALIDPLSGCLLGNCSGPPSTGQAAQHVHLKGRSAVHKRCMPWTACSACLWQLLKWIFGVDVRVPPC